VVRARQTIIRLISNNESLVRERLGLCSSQETVDDIRRIERPIRLGTDDAVMTPMLWDILWSDPTDDDSVLGILSNTQRCGTGTYWERFQDCTARVLILQQLIVRVWVLVSGRKQHMQVWSRQSQRFLCGSRTEAGHSRARVCPRWVPVLRQLPFDHGVFCNELLRSTRQRWSISGDFGRSRTGMSLRFRGARFSWTSRFSTDLIRLPCLGVWPCLLN
jgi:hypothetical protein